MNPDSITQHRLRKIEHYLPLVTCFVSLVISHCHTYFRQIWRIPWDFCISASICASICFFLGYFSPWQLVSSSSDLSLFYHILYYYSWMPVCVPLREKRKGCAFSQVGTWGGTGTSCKRGNHNQNKLYEKYLFSIKINLPYLNNVLITFMFQKFQSVCKTVFFSIKSHYFYLL